MVIFSSRIIKILASGAIASTLLMPAANSAEVSESAESPKTVTKVDFEKHLQGENLNRWNNLSSEQKDSIVATVNDSRYRPGLTQEEASEISPDLKIDETASVVDSEGAGRPFGQKSAGGMQAGETVNKRSTYREESKQLGISLGWNQIEYTYSVRDGSVVSDGHCFASYNQFIPGRTVNYQTDKWIANGLGNCIANWSLSRGWGMAGTDNWEQGMTTNGSGDISNKWFFKK